jgi:imidazolonepropionase
VDNIHLATMTDGYGEINDAALAVRDGKIVWLGERNALPANYSVTTQHDGAGCWVTPGLIDCHTHLVYAGNRSDEFEARLNGVSYETIARQGGGILSTVRATRAATEDELLQATLPRLRALLSEGVTTLEIKSGYGLDLPSEARLLRVARRIGREFPVRVKTTFLGAHALPPEYAGRPDDYITLVCEHMLPALVAEELVDAVDVFCEKIGFTPAQTERYFWPRKHLVCR